jgi:hypothetical protein
LRPAPVALRKTMASRGMLARFFPCERGSPLLHLVKNWPSSCNRGFFIVPRTKGVTVGNDDKNRQQSRGEISDEAIFKVAKEIVVKFIEVGRLTPSSFDDTFERIYRAIERTVRPR